jgi:hypothetical protein
MKSEICRVCGESFASHDNRRKYCRKCKDDAVTNEDVKAGHYRRKRVFMSGHVAADLANLIAFLDNEVADPWSE